MGRTREIARAARENVVRDWDSISKHWKILGVIAGILMAGFTGGGAFVRWGLEAQVAENTQDIAANTASLQAMRQNINANRREVRLVSRGQGYLICNARREREEQEAADEGRRSRWETNCEDAFYDTVMNALPN